MKNVMWCKFKVCFYFAYILHNKIFCQEDWPAQHPCHYDDILTDRQTYKKKPHREVTLSIRISNRSTHYINLRICNLIKFGLIYLSLMISKPWLVRHSDLLYQRSEFIKEKKYGLAFFLFADFLVERVFSFLFSWILLFFLGRKRVFFLFFLNLPFFSDKSVFSFFFS